MVGNYPCHGVKAFHVSGIVEKIDCNHNVEGLFQLECRHVMDLVANPERRPVLCLLGQGDHLRREVNRHNPASAESA
jgi:hypothetical protein